MKYVNPILISISSLFFLFFLCFDFLALSKTFYNHEFEKLGVNQNIENAGQYATNIIDYFKNKTDLSNDYTWIEKTHMVDVKNFFEISEQILFASLVSLIACSIIFLLKDDETKYKRLLESLSWTTAFIILISTFLIITFDQTFIRLHEIIFTNNYWQLSPNSLLIQLFPEQFFQDIFSYSLVFSIVFLLLISLTTYLFIRRKNARTTN